MAAAEIGGEVDEFGRVQAKGAEVFDAEPVHSASA